jgi:hypothetical protein
MERLRLQLDQSSEQELRHLEQEFGAVPNGIINPHETNEKVKWMTQGRFIKKFLELDGNTKRHPIFAAYPSQSDESEEIQGTHFFREINGITHVFERIDIRNDASGMFVRFNHGEMTLIQAFAYLMEQQKYLVIMQNRPAELKGKKPARKKQITESPDRPSPLWVSLSANILDEEVKKSRKKKPPKEPKPKSERKRKTFWPTAIYKYKSIRLSDMTPMERADAYTMANLTEKEIMIINYSFGFTTGDRMDLKEIKKITTIPIDKLKKIFTQVTDKFSKFRKGPVPQTIDFITPSGIDLTTLNPEELAKKLAHLSPRQKDILIKAVQGVSRYDLINEYNSTMSRMKRTIRNALSRVDNPVNIHLPHNIQEEKFSFQGVLLTEMDPNQRRTLYHAMKLNPRQIRTVELRLGLEDGKLHTQKEIQEILGISLQNNVSLSLITIRRKLSQYEKLLQMESNKKILIK